jgi:MFS family permease
MSIPDQEAIEVEDCARSSPSGEASVSNSQRYVRLLFLMVLMFVIVGVPMGVTGILDPLAVRGVFGAACDTESSSQPIAPYPCRAQLAQLNAGVNSALSILNVFGVVGGILSDLVGPATSATIGLVVWTLGTSVSGFAPHSGLVWLVGFSCAASATTAIAVSLFGGLLQPLFQTDGQRALAQSLLTGLWDFAASFNIALRLWIQTPSIELWQAFLGYGLVCGIPAILLMRMLFVGYFAGPSPKGDVSHLTTLRKNMLSARRNILSSKAYWLVLCNTSFAVASGYLYVANVGSFLEWKGASPAQAEQSRVVLAAILAVVAPFSTLCGWLVNRFGVDLAVQLTLRLMAFGLTLFAAITLYVDAGTYLLLHYAGMVLLCAVRILSFAVSNVVLMIAFSDQADCLGLGFGFNFAFGGVVSLLIGGFATRTLNSAMLNNDPAIDSSSSRTETLNSICTFLVFVFFVCPAVAFLAVSLWLRNKSIAARCDLRSAGGPRREDAEEKPSSTIQVGASASSSPASSLSPYHMEDLPMAVANVEDLSDAVVIC